LIRDFLVCFPFGFIDGFVADDQRHLLLLRLIRVLKVNDVYSRLRITDSFKKVIFMV